MSTASLLPPPKSRFFDAAGIPLVGGKVYTYIAGTTTLKNSYTDSTEGVVNANPVILDANGEANIWIDGLYKIKLTDAAGTQQWVVDNVQSPAVISAAMMPVVQAATIPAAQNALMLGPYGYRNLLVNGDMLIYQRGNTFIGLTALTQTLDGWFFWPFGTGTATITRQTNGGVASDGYFYANLLRLQRPAANTQTSQLAIGQIIRSFDCPRLIGQNCYFSFVARKGANYSGGNITVRVSQGTGIDQGSASFIAGTWTAQTFVLNTTQAITTNLVRYSFPLSIFTNTNEIAVDISYLPSGTAGASDYIEIGGVQLEPLSLSNYEFMPYNVQLQRCMQFFQTTFQTGITPAQNVGGNTGEYIFPVTVAGANTNISPTIIYPVRLRTTNPTITFYSPSAASSQAYDASLGDVCTNTSAVRSSDSNLAIRTTANVGSVIGNALTVHITADSSL